MMKKLVLLLFVIFSLSGCYTSSVSPNNAKEIDKNRLYAYQEESDATIIVIRDSGAFYHLCTVDLYINGVLAAGLNPSEMVKFSVKEGKHNLSIRACGEPNTVSMDIGKSQTLSYRIYIGGASFKLIKI